MYAGGGSLGFLVGNRCIVLGTPIQDISEAFFGVSGREIIYWPILL